MLVFLTDDGAFKDPVLPWKWRLHFELLLIFIGCLSVSFRGTREKLCFVYYMLVPPSVL